MCGELGEVTDIIDLVIYFLAGGTLFWNSYDTFFMRVCLKLFHGARNDFFIGQVHTLDPGKTDFFTTWSQGALTSKEMLGMEVTFG